MASVQFRSVEQALDAPYEAANAVGLGEHCVNTNSLLPMSSLYTENQIIGTSGIIPFRDAPAGGLRNARSSGKLSKRIRFSLRRKCQC